MPPYNPENCEAHSRTQLRADGMTLEYQQGTRDVKAPDQILDN